MNTTKWNLTQFWNQNEPALAAFIGNIALLCATISGFIIGIPAVLAASGVPNMVLPGWLSNTAHIVLVIGIICKAATKMFGVVDAAGQPVNPNPPGK